MRIRTAWILALLCLLSGLTLISAAQEHASGSPEDNACNAGGSLEGKCDWPTDAEDDWAWDCGWYIARVDTGEFTINDVPEWCNYFAAPQVVCYDSASLGQLDFMLSAPLNTVENVSGFASVDGSCSGPVVKRETIVSAANASAANVACTSLLGGTYTGVQMTSLGYSTPSSWYACRPSAT
jgi:hypothetical protein